MLKNAYLLAEVGADTAENKQHFAEILPKTGNYPTGRCGRERRSEVVVAGARPARPRGGGGVGPRPALGGLGIRA